MNFVPPKMYLRVFIVNPEKLETGLRTTSAGIAYTSLLRNEAIGSPTFGLLVYACPRHFQLLNGFLRVHMLTISFSPGENVEELCAARTFPPPTKCDSHILVLGIGDCFGKGRLIASYSTAAAHASTSSEKTCAAEHR